MEERDLLSGIAGWLLLPAIGLIVSPVMGLFQIYSSFFPIFTGGTWEAITDPTSATHIPNWGALVIFELIGGVSLIGFGLWVAWLFFTHDSRTPRMFIVWLVASVLFPAADFYFVSGLPLEEARGSSDVAPLVRSIWSAAFWIPYFLKSQRVRNTFTKIDGVESP